MSLNTQQRHIQFLSTLSLRRATLLSCFTIIDVKISIHALLAESDRFLASLSAVLTISIHALLAESDRFLASLSAVLTISIHALLAESDRPQPPKTRVL